MKSEIIYDLTSEDWYLSHSDDPKVEDTWYSPNATVSLYLMKDGRWFEGERLEVSPTQVNHSNDAYK